MKAPKSKDLYKNQKDFSIQEYKKRFFPNPRIQVAKTNLQYVILKLLAHIEGITCNEEAPFLRRHGASFEQALIPPNKTREKLSK